MPWGSTVPVEPFQPPAYCSCLRRDARERFALGDSVHAAKERHSTRPPGACPVPYRTLPPLCTQTARPIVHLKCHCSPSRARPKFPSLLAVALLSRQPFLCLFYFIRDQLRRERERRCRIILWWTASLDRASAAHTQCKHQHHHPGDNHFFPPRCVVLQLPLLQLPSSSLKVKRRAWRRRRLLVCTCPLPPTDVASCQKPSPSPTSTALSVQQHPPLYLRHHTPHLFSSPPFFAPLLSRPATIHPPQGPCISL